MCEDFNTGQCTVSDSESFRERGNVPFLWRIILRQPAQNNVRERNVSPFAK